MAFLRSPAPDDYLDTIAGQTISLRPPAMADYGAWAELRALSRAHLTPWEPSWAPDDLSRMMYRRRLRAYARDVRDDLGYAYFVVDAASGELLGGVTLSNVRRGSSQSASIGYWMGAPHVRRGRMQEAVRTLLPFAFGTLRLHRIEAATMPRNVPSIRVLEASGFEREGVARGFLKINGRWEDHVLYARVSQDSGQATRSGTRP
ncbi:MAG: GNAT family N-acetyltransferase [Hyphomicrobium sp.]